MYSELELVISRYKKDWISAPGNQNAVYWITDTNNRKLYVGSATTEKEMLLQCWENYVHDGHGGNTELVD